MFADIKIMRCLWYNIPCRRASRIGHRRLCLCRKYRSIYYCILDVF